MSKQILIIDSDAAFATILKEGIEMGGEYEATVVTTALDARKMAAPGRLAMAIVDMGLDDADPLELLQSLRDADSDLRLMVIPLEELPEEVLQLGIQGTLPKPFFLPDIPAQIEEAMNRPAGAAPAESGQRQWLDEPKEKVIEAEMSLPASGMESEPKTHLADTMLAHLASESHRLTEHLRYLSRELNADAVLLTYRSELVAYAGHFGRADAERLAQVVVESWQASARVAAALGRETVRFEQSLHEGEDYLLYSLAAAPDIVLSAALRSDRPLGMIRYNTKQTAKDLEPLLTPR